MDERSASRRDLYLTTQQSQDRHNYAFSGMRTPSPSKREAKDKALARAATWIGLAYLQWKINSIMIYLKLRTKLVQIVI